MATKSLELRTAGQKRFSEGYSQSGRTESGFLASSRGRCNSFKAAGVGRPENCRSTILQRLRAAWKKAPQEELVSSDAEMIKKRSPPAVSSRLSRDLKGLDKPLAGDVSDDDDDDDEDDETEAEGSQAGYLTPGASRKKSQASRGKKKKEKPQTLDLQTLLQAGVASGSEPRDLLTMMVLNQLVNQQARLKTEEEEKESQQLKRAAWWLKLRLFGQRRQRSQRSRLEGGLLTASAAREDPEEASKAVPNLRGRVHQGAQGSARPGLDHERVCKETAMGFRCAIMDVATYELLRAGKADIAAAQTLQNLKSKIQAILAGGDWEAAWLLTGLPDPLHRKDWAGSKEEMSIVSGYVDALAHLKKKVRESQNRHEAEEDEAPPGPKK